MGHRRTLSGTVSSRGAFPSARTHDLVISEVGTEVLVYDQLRHHIHTLSSTTVAVWHRCNGQRPIPVLRHLVEADTGRVVDELTIRLALTRLEKAHLLQQPLAPEDRMEMSSRRRFLKRTAAAGTVALPTIISISAPQAAAAQSVSQPTCVVMAQPCVEHQDCCSQACMRDPWETTGVCL